MVATGAGGRIQRGIALLRANVSPLMLVSGVSEEVKPAEFAAEYGADTRLMECCITLGFAAMDTRGNARETAEWVAERRVKSIRFVTSDWHMRRAMLELRRLTGDKVRIYPDAIRTSPDMKGLLIEYNKTVWRLLTLPVDRP